MLFKFQARVVLVKSNRASASSLTNKIYEVQLNKNSRKKEEHNNTYGLTIKAADLSADKL